MWQIADNVKVYIASLPVDMRKSIDGLAIQIVGALSANPQSGDLFLFHNRSRNKVKALIWDKNGFFMIYKRLEKGRFKLLKNDDSESYCITTQQLSWLLAGLDFQLMEQHKNLDFSNYF